MLFPSCSQNAKGQLPWTDSVCEQHRLLHTYPSLQGLSRPTLQHSVHMDKFLQEQRRFDYSFCRHKLHRHESNGRNLDIEVCVCAVTLSGFWGHVTCLDCLSRIAPNYWEPQAFRCAFGWQRDSSVRRRAIRFTCCYHGCYECYTYLIIRFRGHHCS